MSEPKGAVWTEMLYDVGEGGDWSEMRNLLRGDARAQWSETAEHMRTMLPPEFSAGCREAGSIKELVSAFWFAPLPPPGHRAE